MLGFGLCWSSETPDKGSSNLSWFTFLLATYVSSKSSTVHEQLEHIQQGMFHLFKQYSELAGLYIFIQPKESHSISSTYTKTCHLASQRWKVTSLWLFREKKTIGGIIHIYKIIHWLDRKHFFLFMCTKKNGIMEQKNH